LANNIASRLGLPLGRVTLSKFSNKETNVEIRESVREQDVYIIQSGCGHVNDNFMELLIMISACKIASAAKVTAVIPCFPYARQPDAPFKKDGTPLGYTSGDSSTSITPCTEIKDPLDRIEQNSDSNCTDSSRSGNVIRSIGGADHIMTMDLHDPQFQGFFDIPVDNLYGQPLMIKCIKQNILNWEEAVIVSPDAGGAKRLRVDFALIHKERRSQNKPHKTDMMLVGDVNGKVCILIDDIADTSYTITKAAKILYENGAQKIYAIITHAIMSGDAIQRIQESNIDQIFVSDSVPQDEHLAQCPKMNMFNVAPMFAEAIRRTHNGESVSALFEIMN
ncbi:12315_t:CDS:2, partial [Racocetra fulgida]